MEKHNIADVKLYKRTYSYAEHPQWGNMIITGLMTQVTVQDKEYKVLKGIMNAIQRALFDIQCNREKAVTCLENIHKKQNKMDSDNIEKYKNVAKDFLVEMINSDVYPINMRVTTDVWGARMSLHNVMLELEKNDPSKNRILNCVKARQGRSHIKYPLHSEVQKDINNIVDNSLADEVFKTNFNKFFKYSNTISLLNNFANDLFRNPLLTKLAFLISIIFIFGSYLFILLLSTKLYEYLIAVSLLLAAFSFVAIKFKSYFKDNLNQLEAIFATYLGLFTVFSISFKFTILGEHPTLNEGSASKSLLSSVRKGILEEIKENNPTKLTETVNVMSEYFTVELINIIHKEVLILISFIIFYAGIVWVIKQIAKND